MDVCRFLMGYFEAFFEVFARKICLSSYEMHSDSVTGWVVMGYSQCLIHCLISVFHAFDPFV